MSTKEISMASAMETSRKENTLLGKVTESLHHFDVDTNVDMPAEERRTLKIGMTANRLEMDPPLSRPLQDKLLVEMTTMLLNIIEHHGRKNQHLASLEEDLAHAKLEEEKMKATIEALEKEKSEMNARVALMERNRLDLQLQLVGSQDGRLSDSQPSRTDWRFVRGHRTLQDEVDRTSIDVCYQSLLHALKAAARTLPNSLVVFEYMRSIFDSYVNPNNDPNVQPLVKGLDADDFSMNKFFGLQDKSNLSG
ncbi:hypothetical protein R1flu_014386 [Riccia fluitans]|uniref:Uncharacterized protein n=1 Tax=Riccia fluitans TaxID=41844 RepID=A0ABD1YGB1_9MARC